LPQDATCSGPNPAVAKTYSYVVQSGTDLAGLTFSTIPSAGYGLVNAATGSYFGSENTEAGTGRVLPLPNFEWALVLGANGAAPTKADLLYSGSSGMWDAGIACVDATGHVTDSWNFSAMFSASNSDPNGFVWCAVPSLAHQLPEVPFAAALPIIGVAVIGGYVGIRRRRARARTNA
jgi:hypothetical protein